ncbi:MAG: hypothetical protein OXC29_24135 [Rhodococcus sp.]|nr:hypothetical protein [Rhodococcus sp. (in: high G+C Gram-positive bacteria)]
MLDIEERFGPDSLDAIIALASGDWFEQSRRRPLTQLESAVADLTAKGFTMNQALVKLGYAHLCVGD